MRSHSRRPVRTGREDPTELLDIYHRTGDRAIRNRIVEAYRWLAERCAARYSGRGETLEDLQQVATIGLVKAIDRFDPDVGVGFDRFATPTIMGELKRHFRDHTWRVSVPRRLKDMRTPVFAAMEHLRCELRRSPTPDEIAAYLDVDREHVIETIAANQLYRTSPIEVEGDHSRQESVAVKAGAHSDAQRDGMEDRLEVWRLLRSLDERDRKIMYWRFFEERTQSEIGSRLGIGQVQVSRLLRRALQQLREQAGEELTRRSGPAAGVDG